MISLTYIGFSEKIIDVLLQNSLFKVQNVIVDKRRMNEQYLENLSKKAVNVFGIVSKDDLSFAIEQCKTDIFLIYQFGYIIPSQYTNAFLFFNIHLGSLRTNRGAHSHRWSIWNEDEKTYISLYKIDGIDTGCLVCEKEIEIEKNENVISLVQKMERELPTLIEELAKYIFDESKSNYVTISDGIYRKKFEENDCVIDIYNDKYEKIKRKIATFFDFGGAVVDFKGEKYRVNEVSLGELYNSNKDKIVIQYQNSIEENIALLCERYTKKE